MKKYYILFATQLMVVTLSAQLSGNFTIGGLSPDYGSIQSAVNDLMVNGVNGPTTFLIRDGNYTGQINFGIISGVDSVNRITFQGENQDSSLVNINYAAAGFSDNWVIKFDSSAYITLKWVTVEATGTNLSYTTAIEVGSFSHYVHIENCFLRGKSFTNSPILYAAQGSFYEHLLIKNNRFYLGGIAINLRNDGGASLPNGQGVIVENNDFVDNGYGAISMINHDFFEIKDNRVSNPVVINLVGYDAFYFSNVVKGGIISGNQISVSGRDGITLNNCKNPITAKGAFYNNFVSISGTAVGSGLSILGSPVVSSSKTSYWDVFNNTIIVNKSSSSKALNLYKSENNNIYNNIFYNNNVGNAIYNNNASTIINTVMEYNVLYTIDSVVGVWDLNNYLNLTDFQLASSSNATSLEVNPNFLSITDYHLCNSIIDGAGSPLFYSATDLDNELRNATNPDIGADEFNSNLDNSTTIMNNEITANQAGASYQWLDCDNGNAIIPLETAQSFTATVNGNYAVEITMGSCVDTSACEAVTGVGIKETANTNVSIYPNPTNGVVTIDLGNNANVVNYSITTIEGRVIENAKVTTNLIKVDLSKESEGVYFVRINTENTSTVYKLIKQ
ncbi:MAG: T9SS type A sorting domain-containing protein [Flavobacteriales bacterium]